MAKSDGKSVVIQLPDEDDLQKSGMGEAQLEDLVKSMLGGQVWQGHRQCNHPRRSFQRRN